MKTFLEFTGWIELDQKTQMCYIGNGDPKRITLKEWQQLPKQEQSNYIIDDGFGVLYRDCTNCVFTSWDLVVESEYD